jgi:hypothetical protein
MPGVSNCLTRAARNWPYGAIGLTSGFAIQRIVRRRLLKDVIAKVHARSRVDRVLQVL